MDEAVENIWTNIMFLFSSICSEITPSNTPISIDHDAIQDTTCEEIWNGVTSHLYNPEECGAIQEKTLSSSDPCGCIESSTRTDATPAQCERPPPTNVQSCDICKGQGNAIGDGNKIIQDGIWDGTSCSRLAEMQQVLNFLPFQCTQAQTAAAAHCQCHNNEDLEEVNEVIQCHVQEDSNDPCYFKNSNCCVGECKFRLSQGDNVCTTKAAQTNPNGNELPSLPDGNVNPDDTGLQNYDWGEFGSLAPEGACGDGGDSCIKADDCCSNRCVTGNLGLVCAGAGIVKVSASGGGGAGSVGGGGAGGNNGRKRRKLNKTSRPTLKKGGLRRIHH
jgi:hypothetical protein